LAIYLPDLSEQETLAERMRRQEQIIKDCEETIVAIKEGVVDESDFQGDWPREDLANVCEEIRSGSTPSRANLAYFKGTIPWVKIADMNDLGYVTSTEEKITKEALDSTTARIMPRNTVLFAIYASIGKTSILGIEACTNQAIASLVPNTSKISPEYLMYYLHALQPYYVKKGRGTTQHNINSEILKSAKVPIPPLSVQESIVERIDRRKAAIAELEKSSQMARGIIESIVKGKCAVAESAHIPRNPRISDFVG
jgi:type I restriction enzyme S subunit